MTEKRFDIGEFVNVETLQTVLENLAIRVRKRRKESGFSQRELSNRSGVSFASIRRFEALGEISLASLLKIGQALNCLADFNGLFKNPVITSVKDYRHEN